MLECPAGLEVIREAPGVALTGMRILFVALDVPYPADRGQRMRTWSILQALNAEGHEINLVSFCAPEDMGRDGGEMARVCARVDLVPAGPAAGGARVRRTFGRLRGLLSAVPYGAWRFRSPAFQEHVHGRLRETRPHLVVWDDTYNLENLRDIAGVPVVLNNHDIVQVIWRRYLDVERQPLKRAYAANELRKLRRWEAAAYRRVSAIWAASPHDAELLEEMCPGKRVTVVPNAVDVHSYKATTTDDGVGVVFTGGMDWFPNRDAVEFFAGAVLPELRARVPAARFMVVGRPPNDRLRRRMEASGVSFLGRVEDVRPVVSVAAVSVIPLRIGSGTRLKILEAAALGKAMVSTRLGAEGLTFTDGSEIALADEPAALATAVADLLQHPATRAAMGAAARRRVEEEYSFEALRSALRKALGR
jgi:glycosyltransferase involved in cell wall biosynthesis